MTFKQMSRSFTLVSVIGCQY